jgi:hypothetical protein
MPNVDTFFDEIDTARIQRVKELSEIKFRFRCESGADPQSIASKAVVVLAYANWAEVWCKLNKPLDVVLPV